VEVLFKELPKMKEPFGLLKAIKGWIQGIEFRTPGMKRALELIDGVAARVGVEIPPAISSLEMKVEELIDRAWAWDDEDGEANIVGRHIFDEAQVLGGARVTDNAMVTDEAQVSGNARVSDNAVVGVRAQVRDDAVVSEFAVVGDDAKVYGNAVVTGYARLQNFAQVGGNARIGGTAEIRGGTWDGSEGEITSGRWMAPGKRAKP
jgi:carbonic anhydrase/acetyltransferase-like protein (isoleucine patch superfamily)